MRVPLIERLAPGAPELERFDALVLHVNFRPATRSQFSRNTEKAYVRRYRRYAEWCHEVGYQAHPEFITTGKITEFATYCATVKRYAVKTIWQSLRALEVFAEGEGIAVSTLEARGVVDLYRDALAAVGHGQPRRRRRPKVSASQLAFPFSDAA